MRYTRLATKKWQMVHYNRDDASKCVRLDWYSPSPKFDDQQFERTFHLKSLSNLANYDSVWLSMLDCCGKLIMLLSFLQCIIWLMASIPLYLIFS